MPDPATYIHSVENALMTSDVVTGYTIITQVANSDDGYLRIRITLINSDFLEVAEYFVAKGEKIVTQDYRYQWMDKSKTVLRRRWDNTPHHPEINTFPHHCHIENESNVQPSEPKSIEQLLEWLEAEITTA